MVLSSLKNLCARGRLLVVWLCLLLPMRSAVGRVDHPSRMMKRSSCAFAQVPESFRERSIPQAMSSLSPSRLAMVPTSHSLVHVLQSSFVLAAQDTVAAALPPPNGDAAQPLAPETIVGIFVVGVVPFAVATVEFWRRIAVGASFGTGTDSVVFPNTTTIGQDDNPLSSRGRRILGTDALVTAYLLFGLAAAVLALVLVSVVTSDPLVGELPVTAQPPPPPQV